MASLYTVVTALILGIVSQVLDRTFRIPAIVFYLVFGILGGPMVLNFIRVESLGSGLITLVEIAVALILFEGGLTLTSVSFRIETAIIHRLLWGTLTLTGLGAALLAIHLLRVPWKFALLFGAIIIVTGPTVMGSILRNASLLPRLEALLHWESIWGDVAGVVVSAVAIELLAHPLSVQSPIGGIITLLSRVGVGIAAGLIGGFFLLRVAIPFLEHLHDEILPGIVSFGSAIAIFALSNAVIEGSGPLAAVILGIILRSLSGRTVREIRHFHEQIVTMFIGMLFVLLSARVDLRPLRDDWPPILGVALILGGLIRPFAVYGSLYKTGTSLAERTYIAFIGPRGILSIASVAYAGIVIGENSREIELITATVFAIIMISGISATLLCRPLARILKVDAPPEKTGILFVGLNELSVGIAKLIKDYVPVAFIDTNPTSCTLVSAEGLEALCADVVDGSVYEEATYSGFKRLVAITSEDPLNELVAIKSAPYLGSRNVFKARGHAGHEVISVEPFTFFVPIFPEHFTVSEAVKDLRNGAGKLEILDINGKIESHDNTIIPLFEILGGGNGVKPITPGYTPSGKSLCFIKRVAPGGQP
ncbi:cation:proton antiporter [Thermodesulforhabdus norvegica]|uniref:Sodium/proton antiporter, CPA1 family n=1 Tax=Thermodesulforhabdus norvegica TaxID=39841 RepID=A0A1I4SKS8_9BACT|nr:cation:proton antiporter [Thermodesulforhabdus norvegica]SFM65039.1 sodium/proton antiporter, CPA1 family [Thermodesulforhabdus norvegica]